MADRGFHQEIQHAIVQQAPGKNITLCYIVKVILFDIGIRVMVLFSRMPLSFNTNN